MIQAFSAKNPWQVLKAMANKPHINLRLIHADELSAHVQSKAEGKFGVSFGNHKDMKKKQSKAAKQTLQVDTAVLEAFPHTFEEQCQVGIVLALAKVDQPHLPSHFRPIVLLSLFYRVWASLRSRQLLHQLVGYVDEDAHGFLPGREPAHTWLQIQSLVELALQSSTDLGGLSSDVVKAFNTIRREPLFRVAKHIGVPETLLRPWHKFLHSLGRRFSILDQLSEPVFSNIGFPEGCPLPVAAMAVLDMNLHAYMHVFAPQVRTFSFVDNINLLTAEVQAIATAYMALRTFFQLWGMTLDDEKTYVWGTTPHARKVVSGLGFTRKDTAKELGGCLTFCAGNRVSHYVSKGDNLERKWQQLRKSQAPLHQKLSALPICFWPEALHGASGSLGNDRYLHRLRLQAMSALRLRVAGANSLLRFALEDPPMADPGYYQLTRSIFTFRRLCRKIPSLMQQWKFFMDHHQGQVLDGPFTKILQCFATLGWSILTVPWVECQVDLVVDFMAIDGKALARLIHEAWLRHVARCINGRSTLHGLQSLDLSLCKLGEKDYTALQTSQVRSIQQGAFLSPGQQAKFDLSQSGLCPCCHISDVQLHWLKCPRYREAKDKIPLTDSELDELPLYCSVHLLGPECEARKRLDTALASMSAQPDFVSTPGKGRQQIFTDGSCWKDEPSGLTFATWSALNATTGEVVAASLLPGLSQTIARAELFALLAATQWANRHGCSICIWCDSQYTVARASQILLGTLDLSEEIVPNHDLWDQLASEGTQLYHSQVELRWIPSHLEEILCTDSQQEWVVRWNDLADSCAGSLQYHALELYSDYIRDITAHRQWWSHRLRALRSFYLEVATIRLEEKTRLPSQGEGPILVDDTDWGLSIDSTSLVDSVPCVIPPDLPMRRKMPLEFIELLITLLSCIEDSEAAYKPISYVEISMLFLQLAEFRLPVTDAQSEFDSWKPPHLLHVRPTLASVVQIIRQGFVVLLKGLRLSHGVSRLDRTETGITMPCDGLILQPSASVLAQLPSLVVAFNPKGIRKAADLARPCR